MKEILKKVTINSGILTLNISHLHKKYKSIDEILDFASRKNPKRGFLFVSKLLGKQIPVKPSTMRRSYDMIADMIDCKKDDVLVVGMSEAATGLGGGVADSLAIKNENANIIFQHTTRHLINQEEWFALSEDHSHATSHMVYKPSDDLINDVLKSKKLILVDDEISTGKTLLRLAMGYMLKIDNIEELDIVSLVSWLDREKTEWFKTELINFCQKNNLKEPSLNFHSLIKGGFSFTPNPNFELVLPKKTDRNSATEKSSHDYGRLGLKMPISQNLKHDIKQENKQISILGTGEHLLFPFLYAEALEKEGLDVLFQSTTRTPVYNDNRVIKTTDIIPITRDRVNFFNHYVYNLNKDNLIMPITETNETTHWYQNLYK